MRGEKRFGDPIDAPDVRHTRWYQEKNPKDAENIDDEDLDIESIAAKEATPDLKAVVAADIAAEEQAARARENQMEKPAKSFSVESIEINPEGTDSREVVIKAESSLLTRFTSGMREVVGKAATAYENLKNIGTIESDGKRIETGARASVSDMKRGVADFFADTRTMLFGGKETTMQTVLEQNKETGNQEEKEVETEQKYPSLFGELISRLPDAPATMKKAFLAVAVDVPKGIVDAWKRDKALNASFEETMKEEYGEHFDVASWKERQSDDAAEFSPEAIRARREAQEEAYADGLLERPGFAETLKDDAITIIGASAEAMRNMHIAIGRAAKFALYEEPMDLVRGYGTIATSLAEDIKRGAESAKKTGSDAIEATKAAAGTLKEGAQKLQEKAEKAYGAYKEKTMGAKAKRDTAERTAALDRLIDFGAVQKMTEAERDSIVAKRILNLEKQIAELATQVEKGEKHKARLLKAAEMAQKNSVARETILADIKRALDDESADTQKKKSQQADLQSLLNAYNERLDIIALPEANLDADEEITEEFEMDSQKSAQE